MLGMSMTLHTFSMEKSSDITVPDTSIASAMTVMSTGDSLPRSPVLLAASLTLSRADSEQSDTLSMSPHMSSLGSLYFLSSLTTPGGHTWSSGRFSIENSAELSRTSVIAPRTV